jgi:hypothetical protein
MVADELRELARILADWAALASGTTIYIYGSRVRGDHKPTSDVDVCIEWGNVTDADIKWWESNNANNFADINARLPGPLQIIEVNDPLRFRIMGAQEIHRDGNVRCVVLPPKVKA